MSDKYRQYSPGGRAHVPWISSPSSYSDVRYTGQHYSGPSHTQQQRYHDSTNSHDYISDFDRNRISQTPVVSAANAVLSVLELKAITAARMAQQQEQARLTRQYGSNSDTYSTGSDDSARRFEDAKRVQMRNKSAVTFTTKPVTNAMASMAAPIVNAVVEGGISIQDLKALTKLRLSSSDSMSTSSAGSSVGYDRNILGDSIFETNPKSHGNRNLRMDPSAKLDYTSDTSVSTIISGITTSSVTSGRIMQPNYDPIIPIIHTQRAQLADLINDVNKKPSADFDNIKSKLLGNANGIPSRIGNSVLQPRVIYDHALGFVPQTICFDNSIAFELAESVLKSPSASSHGGSLHGGSLHGGSQSNLMNGNAALVNDLNLSSHSSDGKRSPRGIRVSK